MKNTLIVLVVLVVLGLFSWVIVKVNDPWAIAVRKTFTQLTKIELVDSEKLRELNTKLFYLEEERDSILKSQNQLIKENDNLYNIIEQKETNIASLRYNLGAYKNRLDEILTSNQTLSPTEQLKQFDIYTQIEGAESSILIKKGNEEVVETSIERVDKANIVMTEYIYAAKEVEYQNQIIQEQEEAISLYKMRSINLEQQLKNEQELTKIAIEERDKYKDLYLTVEGKTKKNLLIAGGIILVETATIVALIMGSAN